MSALWLTHLHPPADLGQTHQVTQSGVGGQAGQPVIGGLGGSRGHSAKSQHSGRLPSAPRGMSRLAGRTRRATKRERSAAVGFVFVFVLPWRQVTYRPA
jgi:hypothetical protein